MIEKFPEALAKAVKATLEDWKASNKVQRLWAHDASLWTNADEGKWLGWLGIVEEQIGETEKFPADRRRDSRGRIHTCGASGHGRVEPLR